MAKRVITTLIDDLDGTEASETVEFGLDGVAYTIDLSEGNAATLRDALSAYVANGQRMGRVGGTNRLPVTPGTRRGTGVDNVAVREWAAASGIELKDRGRIPVEIVAQWRQSNGKPLTKAPEKAAETPAEPSGGDAPKAAGKAAPAAKTGAAKKAPAKKNAPAAAFSGAKP